MRPSHTSELKMKPQTQQQANHHANTLNKNKGSTGTNSAYAKNQGNRGKQMNPTQKGK